MHVLTPTPSCQYKSITAINDGKGNDYIFANGSGFGLLARIFAVCEKLQKNEFVYLPLNFAYLDGYRAYYEGMQETHYAGIAMVNYCGLQLHTKDMVSVLSTKVYKIDKTERVPRLPKEPIAQWKTERRLTVKTQGEIILISANGDGFVDLAQSCTHLAQCGDDPKYNDYPPHRHHDWKETTSKSAGITFFYWQCPLLDLH